MYVLGLRKISGAGVAVDNVDVIQRASTNFDTVLSAPNQIMLDSSDANIFWIANNGFGVSDIGSIVLHLVAGNGGDEYEIYAKLYGNTGNGVLIGSGWATAKDSNGFVSISCLADLTELIAPPTLTQEQNDAIKAAYNATQESIIFSLPIEQQIIFATGTDTEKQQIIDGLTPEQQAAFNTIPAQFVRTPEQVNADKLRIEQIVFKLKNNEFVTDDDTVFYLLGNGLMADAAMLEVDAGRGFNGLRAIGLTNVQALRVLSIYNVTLDTAKYESELKLQALAADPALFSSLQTYLATKSLTLPVIGGYLAQLRSNPAIYTAIRNWTP